VHPVRGAVPTSPGAGGSIVPLGLSMAAAPARAATAVMVRGPEPAPSPEAAGLETAVLFEIRAALRGADPDHLAAAVGASSAAVGAALASLRDRGTLVQRGARWFMA
jgi:hypothetical protein